MTDLEKGEAEKAEKGKAPLLRKAELEKDEEKKVVVVVEGEGRGRVLALSRKEKEERAALLWWAKRIMVLYVRDQSIVSITFRPRPEQDLIYLFFVYCECEC